MESETLCWDRLLAKRGATEVSSARRTADRGRSLGCEAVEEERTPAEHQLPGPPGLVHLTNAEQKQTALAYTGPGSADGYDTLQRTTCVSTEILMLISFDLVIPFWIRLLYKIYLR